ncbi:MULTISPECIES: hypothetical protein [unclassified Rhizobium]|uniref:hypothetical protein n=1 Tax=unclassified Rhizobium TaxID=2613769 RepID=UPI00116097BD|nr:MULTISPECIES: hypothetical protein [unclassified Rhizobium]TQX87145.1 hypothetical protein EQW76_14890 [Rhizobium sp. rho-13.1]TQY14232.1 hypothetical protein EQW74_13730 [Rhizobium sp. rho-1.1]
MVIDQLFGPWRPDLPALNNPGVTTANNVSPAPGTQGGSISYEPVRLATQYSSGTLASRPLGAVSGQDKAGNGKVYVGISGNLLKLTPATLLWTSVARTGTAYITGTEHWKFTKFGTWVVATNILNNPQYIDMNVDVRFADLTTLVKGRHITTARDFVVIANTNDAFDGDVPYRIRWSGLAQPQSWDFSLTTQADFQDLNGGAGVVQGIVGGEDVTIFMKESIVKMTYVGTPLIWQFDEIIKGKGCAVPESIITAEGLTFFLSNDGFYCFNGSQTLERIGEGKVDNFFYKNVDPNQFAFMSVATDPRKKLIYWNYVSTDAVAGKPDKKLIYNYALKEWSIADAQVDFIFNSVSLPYTIEQLDRYGTIENVPSPFDSDVWAGGAPTLAGVKQDGTIWTFDGVNAVGTIETTEQYLIQFLQQLNPNIQGDRSVVLRVRPVADGSGEIMVSVGSRTLSQGDVSWSLPCPRDLTTGWANVRQPGRFHRVRLTCTGFFDQVQSIQYDAVPAGFR